MYKLAEDNSNFVVDEVPPLAPMTLFQHSQSVFTEIEANLANSDPSAVFVILEHEEATLVAQVLAARKWNWSEDMLALCSPVRREAIANAGVEHAPALLDYVLRSLAERLA